MLQRNDVFILDEPFNGVDIQSNLLINEVLNKLRNSGKIIILSSHIFSTLEESCDQLHLLKNGSIVQSADKTNFESIKLLMKNEAIDNKLDRLDL